MSKWWKPEPNFWAPLKPNMPGLTWREWVQLPFLMLANLVMGLVMLVAVVFWIGSWIWVIEGWVHLLRGY